MESLFYIFVGMVIKTIKRMQVGIQTLGPGEVPLKKSISGVISQSITLDLDKTTYVVLIKNSYI